MQKVVVIGFDGATFDVIKPLVKKGELRTFRKLMKKGVYGKLKSTIPPVSAPAWTSFMTGKNPGKHGIFDFRIWDPKKYDKSILVDSTKIDGMKIWNILNLFGKKVGIINVPLTYPPEKVDGFLISGMLSPSLENFTYPPELKYELEDYIIDTEAGGHFIPSFGKIDEKSFSKQLEDMADSRLKNALKLWKPDLDLFIVIFRFLDAAQHVFWEKREYIEMFYEKADCILEQFLNKISKNTTLFVMSDHGFGPKATKDVHLNDWLMKNNFLKVRNLRFITYKRKIERLLASLGVINILWKFLPKEVKERGIHEYDCIDWSSTKAYFSPKHFAFPWIGIEINVKGKKEMGVVEPEEYKQVRSEVIKKLKEFKDPETGEKVIEKIFKREELYTGNHIHEASDIILKFKFPYRGEKSLGNEKLITQTIPTNIKGEHKLYGIFIAYGSQIRSGVELKGLDIVDIAPIILHVFGLPIPRDMDGRVPKEIFKPNSALYKRKVKFVELKERSIIKEKIEMLKKLKRI
jgi:predicted AlkP superfamily phosphohydrolase/phosphomutase